MEWLILAGINGGPVMQWDVMALYIVGSRVTIAEARYIMNITMDFITYDYYTCLLPLPFSFLLRPIVEHKAKYDIKY